MGKVLEMIGRLILALTLVSGTVSGCGGKATALLAVPVAAVLGRTAPAPGTGAAAKGPSLVASLMADKLTALTAAQAITAALLARERTGVAQQVAVSMLDAAIAFNWPEAMYNHSFLDDPPAPVPNYSDLARLWPARDGQVAIGVLQDAEFGALCAAIERPDLAADPRFTHAAGRALYRDAWLPAVATEIASRDVDTLMAGFIATGAVGGRVNTRANVGDDPQVRHNRSIAEIDRAIEVLDRDIATAEGRKIIRQVRVITSKGL